MATDDCNEKCTEACTTCHGKHEVRSLNHTTRPSLYDKDHRYTGEATQCDIDAHRALRPIFDDLVAKGYSPREIAHILHATVMDLELTAVL